MMFGSNMRKFRKGKGLTQEALAKIIGVSRQAVVSYENGSREPNFQILIKIANVLCVNIDHLLGRDEYSILNNSAAIRERVKRIVGERSIEDFCHDVAQKTGFVVPREKIDQTIAGKEVPDKIVLKVIAMYAGVKVESFY